jgi:ankyrin repeat protein
MASHEDNMRNVILVTVLGAMCANGQGSRPAAAPAPKAATDDFLGAIRNNDLKSIRSQLRRHAQIQATDARGATALMYASLYADPTCVKLLLDKGADTNVSDAAGATALMWAAGNPEKLRLLLAHGANVNARAKSGRTALIMAASVTGNIKAVRLLLDRGADFKVGRESGAGALWAASQAADTSIVKELLARGADPNEARDSATALMTAAAYEAPEIVELLLAAGADVNRRSRPARRTDRGEMTALLWAAPWNNKQIIQSLVDKQADVNVREMRRMSPLSLAVASETANVDVIRLLLERTSEFNGPDKTGLSPLAWAQRWGETPIARMLRDSGATPVAMEAVQEPAHPRTNVTTRQAVEKSVALIQSSNTQFFRATGCVGCHHQMLGGILLGLARQRGIGVNEALAAEQLKAMVSVRLATREPLLQRQIAEGFPMRDTLFLVGLAAQNYPPDSLTDAIVHAVMGFQRADGSWHGLDHRPPLEYSSVSETTYALRAIQLYAPPGWKEETARKIERARHWLAEREPQSNEESVMQLLGLAWAGDRSGRLAALGHRLQAQQAADGGWAQRQGFRSDAYATGQALYALHQAGRMPTSDVAYQRGVRYLLSTQFSDGSWYVKSRAVKFQPYFESGFPHGHDQWISAAGTAWAASALALTAEPSTARLQ